MRPIAILGAGLAGLSLADALLDEPGTRPIVLIDRRTAWGRDRTWCTWETEELRFAELASRRWWGVADPPGWRGGGPPHRALSVSPHRLERALRVGARPA